jgi:hypothetical protein
VSVGDAKFITRGVTPEEKAAVWAVLDAQIEEESAIEHEVTGSRVSDWAKSQRSLR